MCIAIYKPQGIEIFKETLQHCFTANDDGAGFAYIEDKKIVIDKGYFVFDDFYTAYLPHKNKQCIIHFRIKTHGGISVENCHPFSITEDLAFIHNGIISKQGSFSESDTKAFSEAILIPLVTKWGKDIIKTPQIQTLLGAYIGGSKLAFLDAENGTFTLCNEKFGVWDSDVWFSNLSYKAPKIWVPPQMAEVTPWKSRSSSGVKEVPFIMKYTGRGVSDKLTKNTYMKATENYTYTDEFLFKDDIYIIENLWSDHKVDVYSPLNNTFHKKIPVTCLEYINESDLSDCFTC